MTAKTPFEIRADLIKLAQEHLEKQYAANIRFTTEAYAKLVEAGKDTTKLMEMPKYFSVQDILDQAQEFYSFVSKK